MMAGNTPFKAEIDVLEQNAVLLEVQPDNQVVVKGYKYLEVIQENDPDYPNIFRTEVDDWGRKHKVFLLAYAYKSGNSFVSMREELRLQYTEE